MFEEAVLKNVTKFKTKHFKWNPGDNCWCFPMKFGKIFRIR